MNVYNVIWNLTCLHGVRSINCLCTYVLGCMYLEYHLLTHFVHVLQFNYSPWPCNFASLIRFTVHNTPKQRWVIVFFPIQSVLFYILLNSLRYLPFRCGKAHCELINVVESRISCLLKVILLDWTHTGYMTEGFMFSERRSVQYGNWTWAQPKLEE